jgi:hypothetical protein
MLKTIGLVAAALASVTAASAQVAVLHETSRIGSDSESGVAARVVSANAGGARVWITGGPADFADWTAAGERGQ